MKKFKHKITGNIATETNSGKNFKVTEPKSFTLPKWIVENSNEWDEVVEKEYEILSFRGRLYPENIYGLNDKGLYCNNLCFPLNQSLMNLDIFSIKRLSDGEVFTLKDKVKDPTGNVFTISRFYLDCNGVHLLANDDAGRGHISITKIEKVKDPLFTTEDGVDVFNEDNVYCISIMRESSWNINESKARNELLPIPSYFKYFSTREAAEKYKEVNKPQYSKKDMIEFGVFCSFNSEKKLDDSYESYLKDWKSLKKSS